MKITYDINKAAATFETRGISFDDAVAVFAGDTATLEDSRVEYGETRYQTFGLLDGRLVLVVWTPRGDARHIISMRKCNDREKARFEKQLR